MEKKDSVNKQEPDTKKSFEELCRTIDRLDKGEITPEEANRIADKAGKDLAQLEKGLKKMEKKGKQ